jgi:hypothetical protein
MNIWEYFEDYNLSLTQESDKIAIYGFAVKSRQMAYGKAFITEAQFLCVKFTQNSDHAFENIEKSAQIQLDFPCAIR